MSITPAFRVALLAFISAAISSSSFAKDTPVDLKNCPAPVQAVVKQYAAHGTMEEIALDEKKKTGGPVVYEAKFSLPGGKRIEVHISPDGKILQVENKAPKN